MTNENKKPFYTQLFPLDLQFFADGGDDDNPGGEDPNDNPDGDPIETVTLTEKELEERLQRESDKRVSAALKKREETLRKEMEEKIKVERQEAERLAKLSAEEREQVEKERQEAEYKRRMDELDERERSFQRKQLELDTVDVLRERKLPTGFARFVLGDDSEGTLTNIVTFQDEWQQAIEAEVNKRLATDAPRVGTKQAGTYNPWKKDSFNLTEQGRIIVENPELAQKLKAQAGVK